MTSSKEMRKIRDQVEDFMSGNEKRVEIDVPKGFKVRSLVNPFRLLYNKMILTIQKMIPPYRWKNALLRSTGMDIGKDVCMPHYHHLDYYFPELIRIDDGCIVGGLSNIRTHQIKEGKLILGRVHLQKNVLLAGLSNIYPGVTVKEYVITGMRCEITQDCPKRTFVVGQNRIVKEWNEEDMERLFHQSKHEKGYYNNLKAETRRFRKDKNLMEIRILNDGKRMNPGNEWFFARPVWRIYYNAIWVELARITPWNWSRVIFVRLLGAKLGKNVKIGRGTVFDHIYGDQADVGNNVVMGKKCYIDGHSYTIGETIFGRVKIGENSHLGDDVHVMCGVKIGKNCKVLPYSSVMKDIADGETWKGVPAKKVEPEGASV